MDNNKNSYVLGLDIGITSVGFGVIDLSANNGKGAFVEGGVRLFEENSAANNIKRRESRGARRPKRRRVTRLSDMKNLLKSLNIEQSENNEFNPYLVRQKGLTQKLSSKELYTAIMHITKLRGTTLIAEADASKEAGEIKQQLSENDQLLQDKYVCEIQLDRLKSNNKIRGSYNNFRTTDYIKELKQILSNQDLTEEAKQKICDIVQRKRSFEVGPGSEKSPTPYGSYRMIDGKLVRVNLIDIMRGKCSIFPEEKRAPKQSYSAELFNFLNDINNLSIKGNKIEKELKLEIINELNAKGKMTLKQLLKILGVNQEEVEGFRVTADKKEITLTKFEGFSKIFNICKKHQNLSFIDNKDNIDKIMEINTQTKAIVTRIELIKEAFPDLDKAFIEELANMKKVSGYHALSFKALKLITKELIDTTKNQMQIIQENNLNQLTKESYDTTNIKPDSHAILSPVAKRAHNEAFKVINALRKKYGEFESIVIETTREKNSDDRKQRISKRQAFYRNKNLEVEKQLKEYNLNIDHINGKLMTKLRLYQEQEGKTGYTNVPIDLDVLINDPTAYEIDHIIPLSILPDDSFTNKILVSRLENQNKGNTTPFDAFNHGAFSNHTFDEYRQWVLYNRNFSKKKKANLLFMEDINKFEVRKEFINRNVIDTSYASRSVMNALQKYFKANQINTKVHATKGMFTDQLRKKIGLLKDRDADFLHHAIDAYIIASIKKIPLINRYLTAEKQIEIDELTGEVTQRIKGDKSYLEEDFFEFASTLKNIYEESRKYYQGNLSKENMHYPLIKISHKIDTKYNRQLSDETIYSTRQVNGEERLVERIKNIYDNEEKRAIKLVEDIINNNCEDYIMYHKDPKTFAKIAEIVLEHYQTHKDDSDYYKTGKKGIELNSKAKTPLAEYKEKFGYITKYAKKDNGPAVISMKLYTDRLGVHKDISKRYEPKNKKVILKQLKPYRTDIYLSPKGKFTLVTVRYMHIKYNGEKAYIDKTKYEELLKEKKITPEYQFICSLHRGELIGLSREKGKPKYAGRDKIDPSLETEYFKDGEYEILKFVGTKDDKKNVIEANSIYAYSNKRITPTIGSQVDIKKYATDVLGNVYEVKDNVLKFDLN